MTLSSVVLFLLEIICASGVSLLFFLIALPSKIGEKMLSLHFDQRLVTFKGEQDKKLEGFKGVQNRELETFKGKQSSELEQIKEQLSHLGDRGKRSNELEYKALSEVWEKFVDAYLATSRCVVAYLQFPDLNNLSREEVVTFLNATELSERQKSGVLDASDKNRSFAKMMSYRAAGIAGQEIFEARLLLRKNGIFITEELKKIYEAALDLCSEAQVHKDMENMHGSQMVRDLKGDRIFLAEGSTTFDSVLAETRSRLLRQL